MTAPYIIVTDSGRFYRDGAQRFEELFDRVETSAEAKLLLYVHGGLVSEENGRDEAAFLNGYLEQFEAQGWYAGYLVWRSGLGEVLGIGHNRLADDPLFRRIVEKTLQRVGRHALPDEGIALAAFAEADLETAMATAEVVPVEDAATIEAKLRATGEAGYVEHVEELSEQQLEESDFAEELRSDPEFMALVEGTALAARADVLENLDEDVRREIQARTVAGPAGLSLSASPAGIVLIIHIVRAAYRVLKRFVTDRDHGLGPTVVEEIARELYLDRIGAWVWSTMKSDMRRHFDRDGPGTALLDRARAIAEGGKPVRLMVVTHSAGSVFACQLARNAANLPANLRIDLVFLAPAIRMDEAVDLLVDRPNKVDNIRLFALSDQREKADNLKPTPFGAIYRRSLLYLVSGVFERTERGRPYADAPIAGMERHFRANSFHNTSETRVRTKFRGLITEHAPDRLVISPTTASAPAGHRTSAETHGDIIRIPRPISASST